MRPMRNLTAAILIALLPITAAAEPAEAPPSLFQAALDAIAEGKLMSVYRGVQEIGRSGDPRAIDVLAALLDGRLLIGEDAGLYIREDNGAVVSVPGSQPAADIKLRQPRLNNAVRREASMALARLRIGAEDPGQRLAAARTLAANPDGELRGLLKKHWPRDLLLLQLTFEQGLELETTGLAQYPGGLDALGRAFGIQHDLGQGNLELSGDGLVLLLGQCLL